MTVQYQSLVHRRCRVWGLLRTVHTLARSDDENHRAPHSLRLMYRRESVSCPLPLAHGCQLCRHPVHEAPMESLRLQWCTVAWTLMKTPLTARRRVRSHAACVQRVSGFRHVHFARIAIGRFVTAVLALHGDNLPPLGQQHRSAWSAFLEPAAMNPVPDLCMLLCSASCVIWMSWWLRHLRQQAAQ
mmetsp:Transcript_36942/g.84498  ORF Transcript_36942/g.84498 Transcript_36942/m.84498 type:complete len:186 (-) Transcript_36942:973-1530(-)